MIEVKSGTVPDSFEVVVRDGGGETCHHVSLKDADRSRLFGDIEATTAVEAAFRFLLDREPKESILSRFDITVIGRYFPEFERTIRSYLGDRR